MIIIISYFLCKCVHVRANSYGIFFQFWIEKSLDCVHVLVLYEDTYFCLCRIKAFECLIYNSITLLTFNVFDKLYRWLYVVFLFPMAAYLGNNQMLYWYSRRVCKYLALQNRYITSVDGLCYFYNDWYGHQPKN